MCKEPQASPAGLAGLGGGPGAAHSRRASQSRFGAGSPTSRDPGPVGERLCNHGELGLRVGRRGREGLLGLATHHPDPRWLRPRSPARPAPAPPASARRAHRGRRGLRHRPRAAPDPGLWEAGSGNQEVTEEQGVGGGGRGGGSQGRGRGHARRGGAGGCELSLEARSAGAPGARGQSLGGTWGAPPHRLLSPSGAKGLRLK